MNENRLTLGSLFDGSGGFPLGGSIYGIKPVWASEIEPFPILVTSARLPNVEHLGDISQIDGAKIKPVDIITFGSPCQDMSIAGKRSGIKGSRSVLFFEAIRVIKEMRGATNGKYPRYIVWENVPGAFNSNRGDDFKAVLEAVCSVKADVSFPRPEKWSNAGEILGDGFSVAWRTLDAQYWGVPQRRKRIYLVADFAGQSAGEVLFKSEGLSGYSAQGFASWQKSAGHSRNGVETSNFSYCLTVFENHSQDSRYKGPLEIANTVAAKYGTGGNNQPLCVQQQIYDTYDLRLTSENTKETRGYVHRTDISRCIDTSGNAPSSNQGGIAVVSYGIDRAAFNSGINAKYNMCIEKELQPTVVAKGAGAVIKSDDLIVRRITPTECARLQGFPDWWCDNLSITEPTESDIDRWQGIFETHRKVIGKSKTPKTRKQIAKWLKNPYSDSAMYKMWGNGVALPCVCFVLAGIAYYSQR